MGKKLYCYQNIQFLCSERNITQDELKEQLEMTSFQFDFPAFPRASKSIADYFGVTVDEFKYDDLSIPEEFRFLSNTEEKEALCDRLLEELNAEIDKWELADENLINQLYGSSVYKQIAFHLVKDTYEFAIIYNNTSDAEIEKGYKIFPEHCYAYGYVNYGNQFNRFFMSFENPRFKLLCDEILYLKNLTLDKWITRESQKRIYGQNFTLDFSINVEEFMEHAVNMLSYSFFFGKDSLIDETDESKLKTINKTLDLFTILKTEKSLAKIDWSLIDSKIKKFFENCFVTEIDSSNETQNIIEEYEKMLLQIREPLKEEVAKIEEERIKQEKERIKKDMLIKELYESKTCLGNWSEKDMAEFALSMSPLSIEELLAQLEMITDIIMELEDTVAETEHSKKELRVLGNFLWAKRVYTYTLNAEEYELFDKQVHLGESWEADSVRTLLKFINAYKNNRINQHYQGISSTLAEILILLFGLQSKTLKEIEFLRNLHIEAGINNATLDELYEDMCVINCISDGSVEIRKEKEYKTQDVLKLTNAQWTDFFEVTDDKIMYRSFDDVYKTVEELFVQNDLILNNFIIGREGEKKYCLFQKQYNSGLDEFGAMLKIPREETEFVRNGKKYILRDGVFYIVGLLDTIELKDQNMIYSSFPLIDRYLITYIWKYMENYLRILAKFKSKCSYKYGGYYCFEPFFNDEDTLEEISHDYRILKTLIESGDLKRAIYDGMDLYFEKHQDDFEWWKDKFVKNI